MDEMMGGEGSEQLSTYHQSLGYQYIQNEGELSTTGLEMMGGWNNIWLGTGSMMRWGGIWSWIIVLVLLIIIILLAISFLKKHQHNDGEVLEILKTDMLGEKFPRRHFFRLRKS